jgi:hypothetical protein
MGKNTAIVIDWKGDCFSVVSLNKIINIYWRVIQDTNISGH